jgi:hypothetical protein
MPESALPAPDYIPLAPTHRHVISDDKELDFICFGRMLRSELFFGKTEVEHVTGIISSLVVRI